MSSHHRSGLLLCAVIVAAMAPRFAASLSGQAEQPWPALLSSQQDAVDPDHALLQRRAQAALERILNAESALP